MEYVRRYDRRLGRLTLDKAERTADGFVRAHATVCRTGVLSYRDGRGGISRELLPPEEVLSPERLRGIAGVPLTDDHPTDPDGRPVLVTPENAKDYARGAISNDIAGDAQSGLVRVVILAHDADLIRAMDSGKREMSVGRTVTVDDTPGVWDPDAQRYFLGDTAEMDARAAGARRTIPFDRVQRNFSYNHVAVVDRGRAGPLVAARIDADDAITIDSPPAPSPDTSNTSIEDSPMAKIRIDGAEYEVTEGVATALATHIKDQAEKVTDAEAKADAMANELERVKGELAATKQRVDSIDVPAAVAARRELERKAKAFRIDAEPTASDRAVMLACIARVDDAYTGEGKSDDQVAHYFDGVYAGAKAAHVKRDDARDAIAGAKNQPSRVNDLAKARADFGAKLYNRKEG